MSIYATRELGKGIPSLKVEEKINHRSECKCYKIDIEILNRLYPTVRFANLDAQNKFHNKVNDDTVLLAGRTAGKTTKGGVNERKTITRYS